MTPGLQEPQPRALTPRRACLPPCATCAAAAAASHARHRRLVPQPGAVGLVLAPPRRSSKPRARLTWLPPRRAQEEQAEAEKKKKIIEDAKARGAAKAKLTKSMIVLDVKPWDDTTGAPRAAAAARAAGAARAPGARSARALGTSVLRRMPHTDAGRRARRGRPPGDGGRGARHPQGRLAVGRGCGPPRRPAPAPRPARRVALWRPWASLLGVALAEWDQGSQMS